MTLFKYKAFISYSHTESQISKKLLNYLESFRLPRHLSHDYPHLTSVRSIGRIFRDREQLAASDSLEDDIAKSVKESEYLIVLCSKSAAKSLRVAFEINTFLQDNDSANILCLIADGQPDFAAKSGDNCDQCIPEPLVHLCQQTGKTPLAADMRFEGDGTNLAFKKIVASLLNVELDKLMQREARRLQRKTVTISVFGAAVAFVLFALVINVQAAKNAEESAKNMALQQQERAEDLIGFMVDDLVVHKLQELGRVDVIDAVVNKLVDHYTQQDDEMLPPDVLGRKSRVFLELGRVYLRRQDIISSKQMFEKAEQVTKIMLEQYPDSGDALYDYIYTEYWRGRYELLIGNYKNAEKIWRDRAAMFDQLAALSEKKPRFYHEMSHLHIHLGWALMERGEYEEAKSLFEKGLSVRQQLVDRFPSEELWLNNLAGAYHYLAWANEFLGETDSSIANATKSVEIYSKLWKADPGDQRDHSNLARSYRWLAESKYAVGQLQDAKQDILRSVEHFEPVLSFEPDDENKQLQYCWSAVQLIEIQQKLGEYDPDKDVLRTYCPNTNQMIHPEHVKAYNRLLGYRAALLEVEYALQQENFSKAELAIAELDEQLIIESPEVLNSTMGIIVRLRHAIALLKVMKTDDNSRINNIKNTVQRIENMSDMRSPEVLELVAAANGLFSSLYKP